MLDKLRRLALRIRLAGDNQAQDLVEYALLLSLLAVVYAAIFPGIDTGIQRIFRKVIRTLAGRGNHHEEEGE
ncbi:MAG: hypothetical protein HY858_16975 [Candidatus Solibacter usitatus]|nr:hypothetical protein [Candidatus Solibacter usitatus]